MDEIMLSGKKYVSAKRAAKETGYTNDYIGQLCRAGKLPARMVGRNWYIEEASLENHHKTTHPKREAFASTERPAAKVYEREQDDKKESVMHKAAGVHKKLPSPTSMARKLGEIAARSRYGERVVENAFPMRYEIDTGPLHPQITIKKQLSNESEQKPREQKQPTLVEVGEKIDEKKDTKAQPVATTPTIRQYVTAKPSAYVADLRIKREEKNKPRTQATTFRGNQADAVGVPTKPPEIISYKQDTAQQKEISPSSNAIVFVSISILIVFAALYASLIVQEKRSFERQDHGEYQLQLKYFEWL